MDYTRNAYTILDGEPFGRKPLEGLSINIKIDAL
jgi:hypothetical protein